MKLQDRLDKNSAKLMKSLGYNIPESWRYDLTLKRHTPQKMQVMNWNSNASTVSALTLASALEFLEDKFDIHIEITRTMDGASRFKALVVDGDRLHYVSRGDKPDLIKAALEFAIGRAKRK